MATSSPPPDLNRRVAQEIRAEMARQGLDQQGLADRLNVSQAWVSRRISSRSTRSLPLTLHDVGRIADVLQMDPGEILTAAVAA